MALEPITLEEMEKGLDALRSLPFADKHFYGIVQLGGRPARRLEFTEFDLWRNTIREQWESTEDLSLRLDDGFRFGLDPRRSVGRIQYPSKTDPAEHDERLSTLMKSLKLEFIDTDPYRYRRTAATYKMRSWTRKDLAEGIERVVSNVTRRSNPNPPLREAFITDESRENIETLHGFHDFREFLDFLSRSEADFRRLGLGFEGPCGVGVGIAVNFVEQLLDVRTSLPPSKLQELVSPLMGRLDLKLIEIRRAGSTNEANSAPIAEKWWIKHLIALTVSVIGAGSSLAVGLQLYRAFATDYDLQLSEPDLREGTFKTERGQVTLNWYLQPKDTLFRAVDYNAEAIVVISSRKDSQRQEQVNRPPTVLNLASGEYRIEVRPTKTAPPRSFTLVIAAPRSP